MDIFQVILLCTSATCFIWLFGKGIIHENAMWDWRYPTHHSHRTMDKPTFWDK